MRRRGRYGTTPSTGTPVRAVSMSSPGASRLAVAAELVDDEAGDARALVGLEQLERADERGEDAAAIDVADEQHRRVGEPRDVHVDDVARASG